MQQIVEKLSQFLNLLVGPKRLRHILSCSEFARKLAKIHKIDEQKVLLACLSHDMFRDTPAPKLLRMAEAYNIEPSELELKHPVLLHGKIAAEYLKRRFKIEDVEVLEAVAYHTSGRAGVSSVAKIVFLADALEENRVYEEVEELRKLAEHDLDEALIRTLRSKVCYAMKKEYLLLPETIEMWNWLLRNKRKRFLTENDHNGFRGG
ncbi:bis(5'-nucleosyl)-tetraphosphatase (symmetrical) YqeK [Pseudothermotoga sp.]|nr:bis(5'-nucleosyl)-tetraphosphatase (symmetrical) YqeK [Pseudothermotoga sp.]MDW8139819.1 bis(5'-nucleosyl)-tetraphosphatase (symmetrical) YqeK [Pseudothermotoga sp.]